MTTATDGTTNLSFTYDADGLRTSKTVDGVEHTYYYASGKLLRETYGDTTIDFFYDASGNAYALKHNGTVYYYITNLQGDVMSIVDGTGAVVASYEYDPYGNVITATGDLAEINPLRYRGYYFDSETGLYYLQSRYYDPELGRFINADAFVSTGQGTIGYNMFAYCNDNPINYSDHNGYEGFVGFGFQFDISTDHGTFGVEIVIYLDSEVVERTTNGESDDFVIAIYTYSGVSVGLLDLAIVPQIAEMAASLDLEQFNNMTEDEILIALSGLLSDFETSGAIFLIYGYDNFESAEDYSGHFDTWTATVSKPCSSFRGGVYYSYSETCWAVGGKASISSRPKFNIMPVSVEFSHTHYSDPYIMAH